MVSFCRRNDHAALGLTILICLSACLLLFLPSIHLCLLTLSFSNCCFVGPREPPSPRLIVWWHNSLSVCGVRLLGLRCDSCFSDVMSVWKYIMHPLAEELKARNLCVRVRSSSRVYIALSDVLHGVREMHDRTLLLWQLAMKKHFSVNTRYWHRRLSPSILVSSSTLLTQNTRRERGLAWRRWGQSLRQHFLVSHLLNVCSECSLLFLEW